MHTSFARQANRAGAIYDLIVTAAFATPWTARLALGALDGLPLGGPPVPAFEEGHLLFVTLLGTLVSFWSVTRLLRPSAFLLTIDTIGRVVFATWLLRAATVGAPRTALVFSALEMVFFVVQALGLLRERASTRAPARLTAA